MSITVIKGFKFLEKKFSMVFSPAGSQKNCNPCLSMMVPKSQFSRLKKSRIFFNLFYLI
jgi:hypothetical protein